MAERREAGHGVRVQISERFLGMKFSSDRSSPGTATEGKPAAEPQSKSRFAARTCSCRYPSPDHRCRGGGGRGSVLEMPLVH